MLSIGLLSDTHSSLPGGYAGFFASCNEIWHAGDVGDEDVIRRLETLAPVRAVYGNIDGPPVRGRFGEHLVFTVEELKVYITHIGGYPGRYDRRALAVIKEEKPGLFICGHSHILKVINDPVHGLLHINPGAAGNSGWHKVITLMRFNLNRGRIEDLEILETERKGGRSY